MTKKTHVQILAAEYAKNKAEVDRLLRRHEQHIHDTETLVDEVIRKLTMYRVSTDQKPPYDIELSFTLDPNLAMMLRDPSVGGGVPMQRKRVLNLIIQRVAYLIGSQVVQNQPAPTWRNP